MKQITVIFFLLLGMTASAQGDKKVKWEFSVRQKGQQKEIVMKATMEKGWHIYSQNMEGDGPIPTSIQLTLPKGAKAEGKPSEPSPIKHHDENFGMDVYYFNDHVEFVQVVSGKYKKGDLVKGTVTYMTCNDEMCYPPVDVNFEVKL